MSEKYLPIFTYGTLRKGESNYHLLEGKTVKELDSVLSDVVMYNLGSMPGVIQGNGYIHGELMYIKKDLYKETLCRVDDLEGYDGSKNSMYLRKEVEVQTSDSEIIKAWAYFLE